MSSALKQDDSQQHAFGSQPVVTGVFQVTAAEAEAPPASGLQDELTLLLELPYHDARKQAIAAFERVYVRSLLARSAGNVSLSARTAGLDRVYLHRLLRRHSLRGSTAQVNRRAEVKDEGM